MMTIDVKEPNMIALDIDGEITSETMAVGLDELIRLSADIKNGSMFYTIRNFQFPGRSALAVEFKKLPSLFNLIRKFDRIAVLADAGWIKTSSEIEGKLIPGLEIKAFNLDEEDQALAFLRGA